MSNSADEGLPRVVERLAVGSDPARARRELWVIAPAFDRGLGGRRAAGPVDELDTAVGPEQEAHADVPTGRAALRVVDRVDLPVLVAGAAGGLDGLDEPRPGRRRVDDGAVRRRRDPADRRRRRCPEPPRSR